MCSFWVPTPSSAQSAPLQDRLGYSRLRKVHSGGPRGSQCHPAGRGGSCSLSTLNQIPGSPNPAVSTLPDPWRRHTTHHGCLQGASAHEAHLWTPEVS